MSKPPTTAQTGAELLVKTPEAQLEGPVLVGIPVDYRDNHQLVEIVHRAYSTKEAVPVHRPTMSAFTKLEFLSGKDVI